MFPRRSKFLLWFLALAIIMACVPALNPAPAAPPTFDGNAINLIIQQTANAASTQTARALPTDTPTKTNTPRPRGTNTPEPTATETLIFLFETPTVFVLPPTAKGFTPTTNKDYLCEVLSKPANGEYYNPRVQFNVKWRLQNVGRQHWDKNVVDFHYDSGDKFHIVSGYDMRRDTEIGDVAEFIVEMQAPKDVGTYTTYWILDTGTTKFCKVSVKIIVVPLQ